MPEHVIKPVLVIHGGCGLIPKNSMTPEYEQICRQDLEKALKAGFKKLKDTDSSVEAVVEATRVMEDSPCFNAGKGSVFTSKLTNEMDAGIMDGHTGKAGGVSTVTTVKNPIILARHVMQDTNHTVLCGSGAEDFAHKCKMELVKPSYFYTERRHKQALALLSAQDKTAHLDHNVPMVSNTPNDSIIVAEKPADTVGAVAVDSKGRLASASSTGGLVGKMPGRVSDSSVPGAGFFADDIVAVSGTGNGDFFLRRSASLLVANLMRYEKLNVDQACVKVAKERMADCSAGFVAVDNKGGFSMAYNSEGMYRGYITDDEKYKVFVWEY